MQSNAVWQIKATVRDDLLNTFLLLKLLEIGFKEKRKKITAQFEDENEKASHLIQISIFTSKNKTVDGVIWTKED